MITEPADIDLDKPSSPEDPDSANPRKLWPLAVLALLGVLISVGAGYLFLRRAPAAPRDSNAAARPSSAPATTTAEPGEQIALPPLDESDPLVRQLVGRLSSHPVAAAWLTTDGLILNFVVVTTRIAKGETPVAELKAIRPGARFATRTSRDALYIDPSSYRRYDRYADAVSALDARGVARLYATLKPRIRDAYRRTGGGEEEDFDPVLRSAISELLKVPVLEGQVAVEPRGIVYGFADERLEGLTASQKQLLRMGPENVRAVQGKLREIATSLGF